MPAIKSKKINVENFQKFGQVVLWQPIKNPTSQAAGYKFWSDLAHYHIPGATEIGLCTVYQQATTEISMLERHRQTPEILIPIDAPFVVPLLNADAAPDQIEAFEVNPGEAVVINASIWHGACLPVGKKEASYFVIFSRHTPKEDVESKAIPFISIIIS